MNIKQGFLDFMDRMTTWAGRMFICADQFLGVWIRGWSYVWFNGECPSADETISAWTGRNAEAGKRWALVLESCIDFALGAGHCRRAIITDHND